MSAGRGGRPAMPTLDSLGAAELSPSELVEAAAYLRELAGWLDELRLLELERERRALELLAGRPALGYYMRRHRAPVMATAGTIGSDQDR